MRVRLSAPDEISNSLFCMVSPNVLYQGEKSEKKQEIFHVSAFQKLRYKFNGNSQRI